MPVPSLLEFLRMNKAFSPQQPVGNDLPSQGGITGNMPIPTMQSPQGGDITAPDMMSPGVPTTHQTNAGDVNDIYRGVYTPQHDASDKLDQLIDQYPIHTKASLMQKIGASIVGAGYGPEAAMKTLDRPYDRQVEDWKNKLQPTEASATIEKGNNSQERIASSQAASQAITDKRLNETIQHDRETESLNRDKETRTREIQEKRARVYEFKAMHPDWKPELDSKGNLWFVNPQDPTMKTDTQLDQITDMDKINLGITGRIKEIGAQGASNTALEGVRETNRQSDIKSRGAVSEKLAGIRGIGPNSAKRMPTETDTELFDANGKSTGKRVVKSGMPVAAPEERVKVIDPSGRAGTVSKSALAAALRQGYKEVK